MFNGSDLYWLLQIWAKWEKARMPLTQALSIINRHDQ